MLQKVGSRKMPSKTGANRSGGGGTDIDSGDKKSAHKVVTSETHPVSVSWMAGETDLFSRVCLTVAPGKRLSRGRDGAEYARSLKLDLQQLKQPHGVSMIVCLLGVSELLSLGVRLNEYEELAKQLEVEFFHYPVQEMAAFSSIEEVYYACKKITKHLSLASANHVAIHCRGGLGRAGTLAACLYQYIHAFNRQMCIGSVKAGLSKKGIDFVRSRRPGSIESRKQEDCVSTFNIFLNAKTNGHLRRNEDGTFYLMSPTTDNVAAADDAGAFVSAQLQTKEGEVEGAMEASNADLQPGSRQVPLTKEQRRLLMRKLSHDSSITRRSTKKTEESAQSESTSRTPVFHLDDGAIIENMMMSPAVSGPSALNLGAQSAGFRRSGAATGSSKKNPLKSPMKTHSKCGVAESLMDYTDDVAAGRFPSGKSVPAAFRASRTLSQNGATLVSPQKNLHRV